MTLLAKRVGDDKNCKWIYRFWAKPGMGTVSDFVLGSYVLSSKPKTKSDPQ